MKEKRGKNNIKDPENNSKLEIIKWFSELNKNSGNIAGGKGANLGEMYNLKIPVPPGFVVTAQAYDYFLKEANLNEKIKELLNKIEYENTEQLENITKEIRSLIEKSDFPKIIEEEISEAYETLAAEELNLGTKPIHDILKKTPEATFVAVRSSATTEDLAEASFAGQQDTYLNIKGESDLLNSIKKCFASLFTTRATYYRNKKGFQHEKSSLAVIVQKMIDADKSGVIFSKNPASQKDDIIIEAVWGLGEGIVSGRITPDIYTLSPELKLEKKEISSKKIAITRDSGGNKEVVKLREEKSKQQVLTEHEIKKLAEIAIRLEEHYKKPQDIEFAIEGEGIYIVQTRPITTLGKKIGDFGRELRGEVILTGLAASPGIGFGKIRVVKDLSDLKKVQSGDILVTKMTNPDMVVTMQKCAAIVTDEGGLTAHASIVSREMGIPAIVGTQEATEKLKDGEIITVNGFTGKIYKGKVSENIQKEIHPVTTNTKTKIKVIIDLPSFAKRAEKTKLKSVGLARLEGTIAESGKHPQYFLSTSHIKEYENLIFKGIDEISKFFEEIWIRTSDIRSDEFRELEGSPKEVEANPMLGMHGIRYSLKYPEILKAELNAMKRVAEKGKKIGILTPQIISVEEVKKLKEYLREINFEKAQLGIMIETPASVQIIEELCKEKIDFISFGTNDLTQYTLAIDRGNEQVQNIYNELHPAILHQLESVIKICKRYNVETSICGQAGSEKEMVKFLVEQGIDSISVNADVAAEIAEYIADLEGLKSPQEEKTEKDFIEPQIILEKEEIEKNSEEIPKEEIDFAPKIRVKEEGGIAEEKEEIGNGRIDKEIDEKESQISEEVGSEKEEDSKEEILDIF